MKKTTRLPSGKLIDLSRFIALFEDDNSIKNNYKLSLDGLNQIINIDATDAEFIIQKLKTKLEITNSKSELDWDKELQLQKNQPLMKLVKQWQADKNDKLPTEEELREYQDIQESLIRNRSSEQKSKV